jgi:iron complex transport system substrate-binding protein
MRIISLTCSNTEIVCALDRAADLVGVDDHSDFPAEVVTRLPRVGPDLAVDIEKVARLRPDLVLASLTVPGHERVVEGLRAAGLPFLAPEPVSLEDVYRDVRDIAAALGVSDRAEAVVAEMCSALAPTRPPEGSLRPKLLVQWWPKPVIAPGSRSWVHDLIELAGGANLLDEPVKSRPLEDAEVRALAPDAFVLSWCGVAPDKVRPDVVSRNPAWQGLRAIERGRVYCVPEAFLGRPSPRLVDGYRELRRIVELVANGSGSPRRSSSAWG